MENLIINIFLYLKKLLFLFPCEFFCIFFLILNSLIYFLPIRFNARKLSNILITTMLILNSCTLIYLYLNGFNSVSLLVKFLLNSFILFYTLITYKIESNCRLRKVLLNSIIINLLLFGFLIVNSTNFIAVYILLELMILSVYRYSTIAKITKNRKNSLNFILISSCASVLFFLFYFSLFFIQNPLQFSIIQTCIGCAVLLKIGIFPIFNYSMNNQNKTNIPYSILLFCFIPLIGSIAFIKIIHNFFFSSTICELTTLFLILASAVSFAFSALKQKNLVKFLAQTSYFYTSFTIVNFLLYPLDTLSLKLIFLYSFCALGIFSLISIIKINSKKQINTNLIKGLYYTNKPLSYLLSVALLLYTGIIPSAILFYNIQALKNIYIFGNWGMFLCFTFVILNVLIFLNVIKIIQNIFCITLKPLITFKKAAILNYISAFVILLFLLVLCCL